LLQSTLQEDRFLLFNTPLGVPTLPGPVVGRGVDDDDEDDAGSVSSLSSQASVSSDVAGPSTKQKKKMAAKQVMMMMMLFFHETCRVWIFTALVPTYLLQAYFWGLRPDGASGPS
jgi:hypothetical protein